MDVDELIDAVYKGNDDEDYEDERRSFSANRHRGKERCALYSYAESLLSTLLRVPASSAHACFLRTICELHSLAKFYPSAEKSLLHEVMLMVVS